MSSKKYLAAKIILILIIILFAVWCNTLHATSSNHVSAVEPDEWISIGEFYTTGYCKCVKCCGKWAGYPTASGEWAVEGVTVGADWETIPAGSVIYIEGLGERIVQDKPSKWIIEKYNGKILDAYYQSHSDALNHGRQKTEIFIKKTGGT